MATFPTLSKNPVVQGWEEEALFDPTILNEMEGGAVESHSTTTVVPWTWKLTYRDMTNADYALMKAFERTGVNFGMSSFHWINPCDAVVNSVKLGSKIKYKMEENLQHKWQWSLYLIEAAPFLDSIFGGFAMYPILVENLAAGADITDRPVLGTQYGGSFSAISILTKGAPSGVDDSNTVVITLKNSAGETIVTKTFNTATQPPTKTIMDLGALLITELTAGQFMLLSVTTGTTANMPAFELNVEYNDG